MRADEVECLRRVYDAFCEAFGTDDGPKRYFSGMRVAASWFRDLPDAEGIPPEGLPMQLARDAWLFRTIKHAAWYPEWNKPKVLVAMCKALEETLPTDRDHLTR